MNTNRNFVLKFVVFFIFCAAFYDLSSAYDIKSYFPIGEGDSWVYSKSTGDETNKKIIEFGGTEIDAVEIYKLINSDGECNYVRYGPDGLELIKLEEEDSYEVYDPPFLIYPNTEEGEVKNVSLKVKVFPDDEENKEYSCNLSVKLESIEDVEVPAGKFLGCLKFSSVVDFSNMDGSNYLKISTTSWLASAVGLVKEDSVRTSGNNSTGEETTESSQSELLSAVVDGYFIGESSPE